MSVSVNMSEHFYTGRVKDERRGETSPTSHTTRIRVYLRAYFPTARSPTARLVRQSLWWGVTFLGIQCWNTQSSSVTWKRGFAQTAPLTPKGSDGPTQRRCLLLLPPASSIDVIAAPPLTTTIPIAITNTGRAMPCHQLTSCIRRGKRSKMSVFHHCMGLSHLANIYTCLNGNKASSHMKFNCPPPPLDDYLQL